MGYDEMATMIMACTLGFVMMCFGVAVLAFAWKVILKGKY